LFFGAGGMVHGAGCVLVLWCMVHDASCVLSLSVSLSDVCACGNFVLWLWVVELKSIIEHMDDRASNPWFNNAL
jgi:hypothetical protein